MMLALIPKKGVNTYIHSKFSSLFMSSSRAFHSKEVSRTWFYIICALLIINFIMHFSFIVLYIFLFHVIGWLWSIHRPSWWFSSPPSCNHNRIRCVHHIVAKPFITFLYRLLDMTSNPFLTLLVIRPLFPVCYYLLSFRKTLGICHRSNFYSTMKWKPVPLITLGDWEERALTPNYQVKQNCTCKYQCYQCSPLA